MFFVRFVSEDKTIILELEKLLLDFLLACLGICIYHGIKSMCIFRFKKKDNSKDQES